MMTHSKRWPVLKWEERSGLPQKSFGILLEYSVSQKGNFMTIWVNGRLLYSNKPMSWLMFTVWLTNFVGLYCISQQSETPSVGQVERLLKSWCKVLIYVGGSKVNLLQSSQLRAKDALLAELMKRHFWTNEFVHATLAGLTDEMKRLFKEGKVRNAFFCSELIICCGNFNNCSIVKQNMCPHYRTTFVQLPHTKPISISVLDKLENLSLVKLRSKLNRGVYSVMMETGFLLSNSLFLSETNN